MGADALGQGPVDELRRGHVVDLNDFGAARRLDQGRGPLVEDHLDLRPPLLELRRTARHHSAKPPLRMVGGRNCDEVGAEHFRHLAGEQRRDRLGVLRALEARRERHDRVQLTLRLLAAPRLPSAATPALTDDERDERHRNHGADERAARSRVRSSRDGAEVRSHAGVPGEVSLMIGRRRPRATLAAWFPACCWPPRAATAPGWSGPSRPSSARSSSTARRSTCASRSSTTRTWCASWRRAAPSSWRRRRTFRKGKPSSCPPTASLRRSTATPPSGRCRRSTPPARS